jgi:hypothetical protein
MAKTNSEVAQAFVAGGKPCKGSNTEYGRTESTGIRQVRTFTSYSTVVAVITEDRLWWKDYPSNSTQRQLSYVHQAWRAAHLGENTPGLSTCVPHPAEGASNNNVTNYVVEAEDTLQKLLKPRTRTTTKVALWEKFLRWVDRTELLLTLPCYLSAPSTTVMERMGTLRRIRDSNASNPVGLDTIITNVRAIHALEGN